MGLPPFKHATLARFVCSFCLFVRSFVCASRFPHVPHHHPSHRFTRPRPPKSSLRRMGDDSLSLWEKSNSIGSFLLLSLGY